MNQSATPAAPAAAAAPNILFARTPNLAQPDIALLRASIRDYFVQTWERTESLFKCLKNEAAYLKKPISLRHPLIFYYGHTATFFINKLLLTRMISARLDQRLESMFAVGVDEMSWDDLNEANYDWPTVAEVQDYRDRVRALVLDLIDNAPLASPIDWQNPWWAIIMGVEHERIHIETSSVLMRQHALEYIARVPQWEPGAPTDSAAPTNELVAISAGTVQVGKDYSSAQYGWDNEYGSHSAAIEQFQASRYLVSNQEFLAFVEAGGYRNQHDWTEEGRQWLEFSGAQHPSFWVKKTQGWYLRLMTHEIPMPWAWPVEVNYLEAKAFCNWKAAETGQPVRLPTEDEWYRLYDVAGLQDPQADAPCAANLHLDHGASSCAVDTWRHGELYDVVGNVWQWTETPTYPFDGFDVHPIYDDFTTPTFDGRHNLIKGGSWISCGNEAVRASRYAFRRHFFQHAGFRYIVSKQPAQAPAAYYETDRLMSEYAEFHYGDSYFGVPNFPQTVAQIALQAMAQRPRRRALDLGCASGRASFELARGFEHVTGVDFSARFINQGVQLMQTGSLRYTLADEGELVSYKTRNLADLGLGGARNVEFFQGDACNLKPQFGGYDLILAANLLDRLYDPARFLDQIHERLLAGGLLVIASPYTWLEEHTPRSAWLGGFKKDGESYFTLDALKEQLAGRFRLLGAPQDVPFVIRETRRKFQHTISELTIWERL